MSLLFSRLRHRLPAYPACKCYSSLHEVHLKGFLLGLKLGRRGKAGFLFL